MLIEKIDRRKAVQKTGKKRERSLNGRIAI